MPSSVIARIEYDIATRILTITFVSGAVYAYYEVPDEVYIDFMGSGSKGYYLHQFIKGFYAFDKLK